MGKLNVYIISVSFNKQVKYMRGIIPMSTDKYEPGKAVHHVVAEYQEDATSWVKNTYARQGNGHDYIDVSIDTVEVRPLDAIIRVDHINPIDL